LKVPQRTTKQAFRKGQPLCKMKYNDAIKHSPEDAICEIG
jgi:hypothetical protein